MEQSAQVGHITIRADLMVPAYSSALVRCILLPSINESDDLTAVYLDNELRSHVPLEIRLSLFEGTDLSALLYFSSPWISGFDAYTMSRMAWGGGGSVQLIIHSKSSRTMILPAGMIGEIYTASENLSAISPLHISVPGQHRLSFDADAIDGIPSLEWYSSAIRDYADENAGPPYLSFTFQLSDFDDILINACDFRNMSYPPVNHASDHTTVSNLSDSVLLHGLNFLRPRVDVPRSSTCIDTLFGDSTDGPLTRPDASTIMINLSHTNMDMLGIPRPQAGNSRSFARCSEAFHFMDGGSLERPFLRFLFQSAHTPSDYYYTQCLVDTGATRSMVTWDVLNFLRDKTSSLMIAYIPGANSEHYVPVTTYSEDGSDVSSPVGIIGQALVQVHLDITSPTKARSNPEVRRVPVRMALLVVNKGNQAVIIGSDVLRSRHMFPIIEYSQDSHQKNPRWVVPFFTDLFFHDPVSSFLTAFARDSEDGLNEDGTGFLAPLSRRTLHLGGQGTNRLKSQHQIKIGAYGRPNPSSRLTPLRPTARTDADLPVIRQRPPSSSSNSGLRQSSNSDKPSSSAGAVKINSHECTCTPKCAIAGSDTAHGSHGFSCRKLYEESSVYNLTLTRPATRSTSSTTINLSTNSLKRPSDVPPQSSSKRR